MPNQVQQGYGQQQIYNGQPVVGGQPMAGQASHIVNGINVDDPRQNPLYGRWDWLSIFSFVAALFVPIPILPAVIGGYSIYRTKTLHMKGFGLAVAAVIINLIYTLFVLWMVTSGISFDDFYQQMFQSGILNQDDGGSNQISA